MRPIVLAHGFLGYRKFLVWEMFPGVVDALAKEGIRAIQPLVHPIVSIEERAERLLQAIEQEFGHNEPVHLIGHSMGGLDCRYIASPNGLAQGERIISVTTLSTPHRGAILADRIPLPIRTAFSNGAGILMQMISSEEQKTFLGNIAEHRWDGMDQLKTKYLREEFNPRIVDDPHVRYISYAGKIDFNAPTLLIRLRKVFDRFVRNSDEDYDGMVTVKSAKWGEFKGILPADHSELCGLRIIPWVQPQFDHLSFFLSLAKELKELEGSE